MLATVLKLFVLTFLAAAAAHGAQLLIMGESHAGISGGVAGGVAAACLMAQRSGKG